MITNVKIFADSVTTDKIYPDTIIPADVDETQEYNWTGAHSFTKTGGIAITVGGTTQEAIRVGTQANTDGSGISMDGTTSALRLHTDTGSVAVTGDRRAFLSRCLIGTTQTSSATLNAIRGQLAVASSVNLEAGFWEAIRAYVEIKGATTLSAATITLGGVSGYLGLSGAVTIGAAAVVFGIKSIIANEASGLFSITNELTAGSGKAVGYYIAPSTINWTHGLYFAKDTCNVYMQLGELGQNADGSGLSIADVQHYSGEINPASLVKIFADSDSAAVTGDNATFWVRNLIGTTQTSSATWSAGRFHTYVPNGKDIEAGFWNSMRGYVETAGATELSDATTHLTCVEGYLGASGTITIGAAARVACLKAMMANEASGAFAGAGIACGLLIGTSGLTMPVGIYFDSIGTYTTAIQIAGTVTTGIDFTSTTLAPDASRTNSAIAIGDRLGAKIITMAAAVNHLDPMQINLSIAGVNPTDGSTINGIYQLITHSTADMASLRLKCADWTISLQKNVKDAYVYQGELDIVGNVAIGGEAFAGSFYLNAGTGTYTVNDRLAALFAIVSGTATVTGTYNVAQFMASANADVDSVLYLNNISTASPTQMLAIDTAMTTNGIVLSTSGSGAYTTAIQIAGTVTTGIDIGACTTGINFSGVAATMGISMLAQTKPLFQGATSIAMATHTNAFEVDANSTTNVAYVLVGGKFVAYPSTAEQASVTIYSVYGHVKSALNTSSLRGVYGYLECSAAKTIANESSALFGDVNVDNATTVSAGYLSAVHAKVRGDSALTGSLACIYADAEMDVDQVIILNVDTAKTATQGIYLSGAGTYTTGIDIGNATTGIDFTGTYTNGITFDSATMTQGIANALIRFGVRNTPVSIAMTDEIYPLQISYQITANPGSTLDAVAACFKIQTDGSNHIANAQLNPCRVRLTLNKNTNSAYGVQSHINITGTNTSSEIIAVSAYADFTTGTTTTADRVCALQAMLSNSSGACGTVTGDAIVAYIVNAGTIVTTDDIVRVFNQTAATAVNGIHINNDGAGVLTSMLKFTTHASSTTTNLLEIDDNATALVSTGGSTMGSNPIKIKINIDGATKYLVAADNWT